MELKINEERIKSVNYQLPNGKIVGFEMDNGEISDITILSDKKKLSEDEKCKEIINVLKRAREERRSWYDTDSPVDFVRKNPFDVNHALVEAINKAKGDMKDKESAVKETLKMALKDCDDKVNEDNRRLESMQAEPKDFTDSGTTNENLEENG